MESLCHFRQKSHQSNHHNHLLSGLMLNNSLIYHFYKVQFNDEYHSNFHQIRVNATFWEVSERERVRLIIKGSTVSMDASDSYKSFGLTCSQWTNLDLVKWSNLAHLHWGPISFPSKLFLHSKHMYLFLFFVLSLCFWYDKPTPTQLLSEWNSTWNLYKVGH